MIKNFRAPAVPLTTHDPFFSVWSFADKLTDDTTRHWTGVRQFMIGVAAVDGILYEFMGKLHADNSRYGTGYKKMKQVFCKIRPLSTEYLLENDKIKIDLTFTSPIIPNDLDLMSRPATYITYKVESKDGAEHEVKFYFGFSAEFCVNTNDQQVSYGKKDDSAWFTSGTDNMLKRSGDDHRIEWGTFYVTAPERSFEAMSLRAFQQRIQHDWHITTFAHNNMDNHGPIMDCLGPKDLKEEVKYTVGEILPTIVVIDTFKSGSNPKQNFIVVSYDDCKSINYFGVEKEAYWHKYFKSFEELKTAVVKEYSDVVKKVSEFEKQFYEDTEKFGKKYSQILALAFRQVIAGHKLIEDNGKMIFLSKENYSNGCIGTVDVTYPSIPMFLYYNPSLVEGMLNPIFTLIDKGFWTYEFAPHDVGQYPFATGQVYGFSERHISKNTDPLSFQMPVEECGNMILCVAALSKAESDYSYFVKHKIILKQWADYLVKVGFDPDEQLCTDDFAGHLNHNCNLAVKAICALGSYAQMAEKNHFTNEANYYRNIAKKFAKQWESQAFEKDHYKLTYDGENTWSLKYNMVWDKLLGLNLFSESVYTTEIKYYKKQIKKYGIPLDCRGDSTKTDWEMWTTVLSDDKRYFKKIVNAMWNFLCETEDRVPFGDLVFATRPVHRGFQARTVQGGLFINLLRW